MTAEQRVKQVYPDAYLASGYSTDGHPDTYQVYRRTANGSFGGVRETKLKAWASAWNLIQKSRRDKAGLA